MIRFLQTDPQPQTLDYSWGNVARYGVHETGFRFELRPQDSLDSLGADDWALTLRFKIGPSERASDLKSCESIRCNRPDDLASFSARVEGSSAFQALGRAPAAAVALTCCDLLSTLEPLVDCWGVRDPRRPIVRMTEGEWLTSTDAPLMLRWFRQQWRGEEADLDRLLHRYCLACCRKIWRLLPHQASRTGVEVAERFIEGLATADELGRAEYEAEGGAFEFELGAEVVAKWTGEASRIPRDELDALIHSPRPEDDLTADALLKHAAYFADVATVYPSLRPKEAIEHYRLFLSTHLLRETVGNPFRPAPNATP